MADTLRLPSRTRYVEWLREHPGLVLLAVVVTGTIVRVRVWLFARSIWHDEAMLALNVLRRSLTGLLGPLDYRQLSPPGYLWAIKAIVAVAGPGELSLRLLSMMTGVATIVVVWWIGRRIYGEWAGVMSAATIALAPGAIYYSNELKPYACDSLIAALLIVLCLRCLDEPLSLRRGLMLAFAGSVALWTSYAAVFVLAAMGLSLAIASWERRRGLASLAMLGLPVIAWSATFGVVYYLARRAPTTTAYMQQYWRDHFIPVSLTGPEHLASAMFMTLDAIVAPLASPIDAFNHVERLTALVLALSLIGGWVLVQRRTIAALCLLVMPAVVVWLAAVAHVYPLDGRLLLFLLPAIVTLSGGGVTALAARGAPAPALLAAAVLLSWPAINAVQTVRHPDEREDAVTLLRAFAVDGRPGDVVYVWRGLDATLEYYRSTRPALWPAEVRIVLAENDSSSAATYLSQVNALCGSPRVWLLATHPLPTDVYGFVTAELQRRREVISVRRAAQSELTLLRLTCGTGP